MGSKGIRLRIKVVPRASRQGFAGLMADGRIRIALTSPPVDGKANEELVRFLAGQFGTARGNVEIISGQRSRIKSVVIAGSSTSPEWFDPR